MSTLCGIPSDALIYDDEDTEQMSRNTIQGVHLRQYTPQKIKSIRQKANMTQCCFAFFMGVTNKSVQSWQRGINRPDGPSRRLLGLIEDDPQFAYTYGIVKKEPSKSKKQI